MEEGKLEEGRESRLRDEYDSLLRMAVAWDRVRS